MLPDHSLTPVGRRIGCLYDRADDRARDIVDVTLKPFEADPDNSIPFSSQAQGNTNDQSYVELYSQKATAGLGNYLESSSYSKAFFRSEDIPSQTDFAVWISGKSMEPEIYDNDIAFIQSKLMIDSGQIGIFLYEGESYCKKLIIDHQQRLIRLVSLNKLFDDIIIYNADDLYTFGLVLGSISADKCLSIE